LAGFVGSKCGGAKPMQGSSAIIGVDDPSAIGDLNDLMTAWASR